MCLSVANLPNYSHIWAFFAENLDLLLKNQKKFYFFLHCIYLFLIFAAHFD